MTFRSAAVVGGDTISKSRSPLVHGHWLHEHELRGAYVRVGLFWEGFPYFSRTMADEGYVGVNVTVPFKEVAFKTADELSDEARALGAVNLYMVDGTRRVGFNTDMVGFLQNLDEGAPGWIGRGHTALVLGAGGAARAIVYGLVQRGFGRVVVANRTFAKAEALREAFGPAVVPVKISEAHRYASESDLIVNSTSYPVEGMAARPDAPPVDIVPYLDLSFARPDCVITDAIYVPLETPFLRAAKARGLRTVDGLGMLLHQAVPSFERFFGVRPTVTPELRALVVADIENT